jgi:hypothetical protein
VVEKSFAKNLRTIPSCRAEVLVAQIVNSTTSSGSMANENAYKAMLEYVQGAIAVTPFHLRDSLLDVQSHHAPSPLICLGWDGCRVISAKRC